MYTSIGNLFKAQGKHIINIHKYSFSDIVGL